MAVVTLVCNITVTVLLHYCVTKVTVLPSVSFSGLALFAHVKLLLLCRQIPEGTGWILEGYPNNYSQAKLLEKALTGCDVSAAEQKQEQFKKAHKNSLLPYPQTTGGVARSGIDVVILFDIRDELCLKRATGRYGEFFTVLCLILLCIVCIKIKSSLAVFLYLTSLPNKVHLTYIVQ